VNEQVIEAAYEAFKARARTIREENDPCTDWHWDGEEEYCVEWDDRSAIAAAIGAADEARAAKIRQSIDDLILCAVAFGSSAGSNEDEPLKYMRDEQQRLLRLCGIDDQP